MRRFRSAPSAAEGREAAGELLGRYRSRVFAWCWRRAQNREQALDLAQDTLLRAYRNLGSYEGPNRFGGWLFMIARNRCRSAMKLPALLRDDDAVLEDAVDPRPGPQERAETSQAEERILTLIRAKLDATEQTAIWLRCFEGVSVDEITHRLRIEQASGARGVLQSARRKLRAAMELEDWEG
ncbi:MAG: sigma-70 family RNA polymerase sigma factor [bacterium]